MIFKNENVLQLDKYNLFYNKHLHENNGLLQSTVCNTLTTKIHPL